MSKLDEVRKQLKKGDVYRRKDFTKWSKSVSRHLDALVKDGTLQKLSAGLYYVPEESVFGKMPPNEEVLIKSFLKGNRFLVTSPNAYNSLGVGTTQLYNVRMVYNHKRHGEFTLGNRKFLFQVKPHFPKKLTQEFLLVDLVNNLNTLAEDPELVLTNVVAKVKTMDKKKLTHSLSEYGNVKAKKILQPIMQ